MRKDLIIFTHGAPFVNGENAFLMPEIPLLAERFERVVLVPNRLQANVAMPIMPLNVEVYDNAPIRNFNPRLGQLKSFFGFSWVREWSDFNSIMDFRHELLYIALVRDFKRRFWQVVRDLNLKLSSTLFYSFWFTEETSGLAEIAVDRPELRFISRAHGYDLYDYRVNFRSRYYRELALDKSSGIYCCSKDGLSHLKEHYCGHGNALKVGYLGVRCSKTERNFQYARNPKLLKLVTVANLVSGKQICRFLKSLIVYSNARQKMMISYDIIGEGAERDNIALLCKTLPKNLKVTMWGLIPNTDVLRNYETKNYDLFVLPSASEGLSVAIMEAMEHGIPALATRVGGLGEVVEDGVTGYLINSNFRDAEVASCIDRFIAADICQMRFAAMRRIRNNFECQKLRTEFANSLLEIT